MKQQPQTPLSTVGSGNPAPTVDGAAVVATAASTQIRVPGAAEVPGARRQVLLLTAVCAAAGLLCLVLWQADRSAAAELQRRTARAVSLAVDARRIAEFRRLPQQASEGGLRQADLLDQANQAMQAVGLEPEALISTEAEPPRQLPNSNHAEIVHRLVFENVRLEDLIRFCHGLTDRNPSLRIPAIQLRAGGTRGAWNVDVSVAYWVFVPGAAPRASDR